MPALFESYFPGNGPRFKPKRTGDVLPLPVLAGLGSFHGVMAGLVPAIHVLLRGAKNVDARDKPGHDDLVSMQIYDFPRQAARGAEPA